ncbi:hypothetical protein CHUAL_011321 [Chamberlinius hualienensis]
MVIWYTDLARPDRRLTTSLKNQTYEQAVQPKENNQWIMAILEQINIMIERQVWDLVVRPTIN